MKKKTSMNGLRKEYDFSAMSGGVRGKYANAYRAGTNIVVLADDVASAFPTDAAVNGALRTIMEAARAMPRAKAPSNKAVQRRAPERRR
jgi:hypothetical protein